jgi:hypothetical protein
MAACLALPFLISSPLQAQLRPAYEGVATRGVLTHRNNNQRTGTYLSETVLTPDLLVNGRTVNGQRQVFGRLHTRTVDGSIYGQPLYVPNVPVYDPIRRETRSRNCLYVVTTNNTVYCFDADNATGPDAAPVWQRNFNYPLIEINPVPSTDVLSDDIVPVIGIVGTPVIRMDPGPDPITQPNLDRSALYVVVRTKEGLEYRQRLYALDLRTGASKLGSPVTITGTTPGTGDSDDGTGNLQFNSQWQNQRAALTLVGDTLYIAWGSHSNNPPYHGWIMSYDAVTLAQQSVFVTTPNGVSTPDLPAGGGIWMSGSGLAVDDQGNIFFNSGNGLFNGDVGGTEFGSSVLRVTPGPLLQLELQDYFTPFNWLDLSLTDTDLGSGGVTLLPREAASDAVPELLVTAGKEGTIYLLDRANLGRFNIGEDTQIMQSLPDAIGASWGAPAYYRNRIYYHGVGDVLKAFGIGNAIIDPVPTQGPVRFEFPGASPVISANGQDNGIVWEVGGVRAAPVVPGAPTGAPVVQLVAYDANDVSRVLYNSFTRGVVDTAGRYTKFTVPTIADGKVFIGGDRQLTTFGFVAPKPVQAARYVITGPVINFPLIHFPVLTRNIGTAFSITAIGTDGRPLNITSAIQAMVREPSGALRSLGTLRFNNQSNLILSTSFRDTGTYAFMVRDQFGVTNSETFQVTFPAAEGLDHFVLRGNSTVRVGQQLVVTITAMSATKTPVTLIDYDQMTGTPIPVRPRIIVTRPDGTQTVNAMAPGFAYLEFPRVSFFNTSQERTTLSFSAPGRYIIFASGSHRVRSAIGSMVVNVLP